MSIDRRRVHCLVCLIAGAVLVPAPRASGQRPEVGPEAETPTVAAPEIGNDAAAEALDGPESDAPGTRSYATRSGERTESFLSWMVRASGFIGLVILGMSFYLVAVVVWMFVHYRRAEAVLPEGLVEDVADAARPEAVRQGVQPAGRRLLVPGPDACRRSAQAARRSRGRGQRALEMANEDVTMEMEHRTTYLATVGTLGPMIGLVGTVYGMIRSFQAIAMSGATPQADQLAAGISTALFVTLEGIALSVPAIAFYALFRNRIARLSLEVQLAAESLLEQFAPGVRAPHPLVAATANSTPAGPPPLRTALPPKEADS